MSALFPALHAAEQQSEEASTLDRVEVIGRRNKLLGRANSASEGQIGRDEIERRPRLRAGDLAEYVPGVAATQHSGAGKANQYFLRGFNLDHGTDLAQYVDGMPINMPTHGHGQGYSDLNFIIPELVDSLTYRKGPYFADVGDFSSAGSVDYHLADGLDNGLLQLEGGGHGYSRLVIADSAQWSATTVTWGIEGQRYDGPWSDIDEDVAKRNAMLRLSMPIGSGRGYALAMYYRNHWNSPDQIPARAVGSGLIDEYGSIDTTVGGDTKRRSLSAGWDGALWGGNFQASAYLIDYDLSLWSDFTYYLDNPDLGDQFEQFDHRTITGFDLRQSWSASHGDVRAGLQGRRDDIGSVGLSHTWHRQFVSAIRDDAVDERSLGLWLDGEWRFTDTLRAGAGVRHDRYDFDVDALQLENSGSTDADLTSFKTHLAWHVADPLELYLNWGQGMHSNDARGSVITIDPITGEAALPVTPLVRSVGSELGMRWFEPDRFNATLVLWQLDLDSELLFVGDAGSTEASRPSERSGVELAFYWLSNPLAKLELEASYTHARFSDADAAGDRIPGSVPLVLSAGWSGQWNDGWHAALRVRHIGRYPLIEDDSVRSSGSTMVNLAFGRHWQRWGVELDVLNLLDADDHDIDYLYVSRLSGEAADGIEDVHYHVFEPRSFRIKLTCRF